MKFEHLQDERFHEVMGLLAEQSGQPTNDFKDRIYAEGLSDIPIEAIQEAAWTLVKTRTFASFPKIGELRDMLGGKAEDQGEVQAALVWQSIGRYGAVRSVVFDDPTTMAVIQQCFGGWQKMCSELTEDKLQWFLKDFSRHYIAFRRSNVKHYGMLPGWADPVGRGPALIGNAHKAQLVLDQGKDEYQRQSIEFVRKLSASMDASHA